MKKQTHSIPVSESIGSVSAESIIPSKAKCIIALAHGAGAGMNHAFMVKLSEDLAAVGIGTLRFNFPFTEQKKKRPDMPPVAHKTIEAVIAFTKNSFPKLPLFVAGKSFGGRMSSQFLASHPDEAINGIIFYGFPLHAAGNPSIDRAEHLKKVKVPMLFLQGTRDALADLELIKKVCKGITNATLITLEGADHSFKSGKKDFFEELTGATSKYISDKINA